MNALHRSRYWHRRASSLNADADLYEQKARRKREAAQRAVERARQDGLLALERMTPEGRA